MLEEFLELVTSQSHHKEEDSKPYVGRVQKLFQHALSNSQSHHKEEDSKHVGRVSGASNSQSHHKEDSSKHAWKSLLELVAAKATIRKRIQSMLWKSFWN